VREPKLSDTEQRIFDVLSAAKPRRGSRDVPIPTIFRAAFGDTIMLPPLVRTQQQRLGLFFTRMNRKLAPRKLKIEPGLARRSYRLTQIS
jgi:hypothetical protein